MFGVDGWRGDTQGGAGGITELGVRGTSTFVEGERELFPARERRRRRGGARGGWTRHGKLLQSLLTGADECVEVARSGGGGVVVVADEGEGHVNGGIAGRGRRGPLNGGAGNEELLSVCVGGVVAGVEGDEAAAAGGVEVAGGGGDAAPAGRVEMDVLAVADVLLVEAVEGDGLLSVGATEEGEKGGGEVVRVAVDEAGGAAGGVGELFADIAHVHVRLDVAAEAVFVETLAGAHLAVEAGLLQAAAAALLLLVLVFGVADAHLVKGWSMERQQSRGEVAVVARGSFFMSPRAFICARAFSRPGQSMSQHRATPP